MRLFEYKKKTLKELFSEYASKENQSLAVQEVYARIYETFELLDKFPNEVDQCYRLVVDLEPEAELYRMAADELEGKGNYPEAVSMVYAYEIERLSDRPVHTAKEKIRARLKANMKLSLLLLEDGYEDAAVDNILKLFR